MTLPYREARAINLNLLTLLHCIGYRGPPILNEQRFIMTDDQRREKETQMRLEYEEDRNEIQRTGGMNR